MKVALVVLVVAVAGALAAADRAGRAPLPRTAAAPVKTPVPVGESPVGRRRAPRPAAAARPVPSRDLAEGVLSPDGRSVALAHETPGDNHVRIYDLRQQRMGRPIALGGEGNASHLTWLSETRLALFTSWISERATLIEVDVLHGKVVSRRRTRSFPIATARSAKGLVALMAPAGRIGRAKLLTPNGTQPLHGIRAGRQRGETTRTVSPGLAVDPESDTAYVVDAENHRFGKVDLETGTSAMSLTLGNLARAAKVIDSVRREAVWLGDGRFAVTGSRDLPDGRIEPYGLRLVDVAAGREIVLAPEQSTLAATGSRVLAWGDGLSVFGVGGSRERRVLRGTQILHVETLGDLAYAQANRRTYVVDVATGKVVSDAKARRASAPTRRARVLGVSYPHGGQGRLAWFDARTLKRIGRTAIVRGYLWGWDRSPSGTGLALGVSSRGRVQIFGTDAMTSLNTIETGRRDTIRHLRWVSDERMLAITGFDRAELLEIDLVAGRVTSRRPLGGRDVAVEQTADGFAVLLAPKTGVGDARLLLLGAERREIPLPGVKAGYPERDGDLRPDDPPDTIPGLAIDGDAAYVAPTESASIVRVELSTGAVSTHAPVATAAKGGGMRLRFLRRVAPGKLLHGGSDTEFSRKPVTVPLRIVDVVTWTSRAVRGTAGHADASPAGLLAANYERRLVTVHDLDGRRRATFKPRFGVSRTLVAGRHGYVMNGARRGANRRTHVLDLRTGRKLGSVPFTDVPHLLVDP